MIAQLLVYLLHLAHLVFPHDSSGAGPLATVDVLERRMSASRSVGGLLAKHIAECVGNKFRKREGASCRRRRGRGSEVRSGSSSSTDTGDAFWFVPAP